MDKEITLLGRIVSSLETGYQYCTLLLLFLYLLKKNRRADIKEILDCANLIAFFVCLAILFINFHFIFSVYLWNDGRWNLNKLPGDSYQKNSFIKEEVIYLLFIIFYSIAFFFKKLRQSILATIIFTLLIKFSLTFLLIRTIFTDYIPSSWSVYYNGIWESRIFSILLFSGLTFLIYLRRYKKVAMKTERTSE